MAFDINTIFGYMIELVIYLVKNHKNTTYILPVTLLSVHFISILTILHNNYGFQTLNFIIFFNTAQNETILS